MIPYSFAAEINVEINGATAYRADVDLYGKPDFWDVANGQGDCEDYALAKRARLRDHGEVRLATCWTEDREYHAVLIATTDEGEFVLDNRYATPMRRDELGYRWDTIERGREMVRCCLIALLALAGCSTPPPFIEGAPVAPPAGWIEYCIRTRKLTGRRRRSGRATCSESCSPKPKECLCDSSL